MIGFHGQTVLHRPEDRLTVQIGDGAALARRLGIKVASDFRAEDVAAGGQGAPLVPVYHRALVTRDGLDGPVVVINIGGVANITYVIDGADPIACDTGAGQRASRRSHAGAERERHSTVTGATAARGTVGRDRLGGSPRSSLFRAPRSEIARPQRLFPVRRSRPFPRKTRPLRSWPSPRRPLRPRCARRQHHPESPSSAADGGSQSDAHAGIGETASMPGRNRRCARLVGRGHGGPGLRPIWPSARHGTCRSRSPAPRASRRRLPAAG